MSVVMIAENFPRLLDDRLTKVFENEWKEIPDQRDEIYTTTQSDRAWEEFYGVSDLPDVPAFNGALEYLGQVPEYLIRVEPKTYAAGVQWDQTFLEDKRYKVMTDQAGALTRSMRRVYAKKGMELLSHAWDGVNLYASYEEGLSLCNSAHTTKAPVSTASGFSNTGTSAISKTSIGATRIAMMKFRNSIGQRIDVSPDTIFVPITQMDAAFEAVGDNNAGVKSMLDPDSANHKINAQFGRFRVVPLYRLDDYLTQSWFMADSKMLKRYAVWLERVKPATKTTVDFETFSAKWSVRARFGAAILDWRPIYGHYLG